MAAPRPLRTAAQAPEVPPPRRAPVGLAPTPACAGTHADVPALAPPPAGAEAAMAVAAGVPTLPAVVEELLSEMAAAVRDGAPSRAGLGWAGLGGRQGSGGGGLVEGSGAGVPGREVPACSPPLQPF